MVLQAVQGLIMDWLSSPYQISALKKFQKFSLKLIFDIDLGVMIILVQGL